MATEGKQIIRPYGDRRDDGVIQLSFTFPVPLSEKAYIMRGASPSDRPFDVTVPKGRLWVMGDNRSNSEDSRYHQDLPGGGTVPEKDVVGKVWAIVWPFDRAHRLSEPSTFENPRLQATHR